MIKVAMGLTTAVINCMCETISKLQSVTCPPILEPNKHKPISQYTCSLMSALSDHITAPIPIVRHSQNSQKHKNATPKFQLCRTMFVKRTRRSIAAAKMQTTG